MFFGERIQTWCIDSFKMVYLRSEYQDHSNDPDLSI